MQYIFISSGLLIALYVSFKFYKQNKIKQTPFVENKETGLVPAQQVPGSPQGKRLDIVGTIAIPVVDGIFVSAFGLQKNKLIDLVHYAKKGAMDSFPEDVQGCLRSCYSAGHALGLETRELVRGTGLLQEGYALYFALIDQGLLVQPQITAFVGKTRE